MDIDAIINRKALIERLEGDFELFKELAELFMKESPRLLADVEEAVKDRNGVKIGKAGHTIKGAISNFSAEKAFQAAFDLELTGKNNELDKVDLALINLTREVSLIREALAALIKENRL